MVVQSEFNITIDMIGAPTIIIEAKPDGRFVYSAVNRATEEYYGFPADYIVGQEVGISDFSLVKSKRVIAICKQCVATKESLFLETKHRRPDGSYRWARNTLIPILDYKGEATRLMGTFTDITELVETQKRLEDAQKYLEEALTKTLSGFVKICTNCKKIHHNDEWQSIERYASEKMDYHEFSHGMCEPCAKELYGDDILDP